jgi:hypothetical protein
LSISLGDLAFNKFDWDKLIFIKKTAIMEKNIFFIDYCKIKYIDPTSWVVT